MAKRDGSAGRAGAAAALLILVGALAWVAYRLAAGTENHAYSPGAVAPAAVQVTRGHDYELSYPGGVAALAAQGIDPDSLQCDWSQVSGGRQALPVDELGSGSVARNVVATFSAPVSGSIHVACDGIGAMFVDDSDDAGGDPSGWFLAGATTALTVGIPLALSAARLRRAASGRAAGEHDEVERLVGVANGRVEHDEVLDADGDDVLE